MNLNTKKLFVLLITCIFFNNQNLQSQKKEVFQEIFNKLNDYAAHQGPEKVYLHTDKDLYTSGETIWFKAYLLGGVLHTKSDKSQVIYIDLFGPDGTIVDQRTLFIDALGVAGDFKLDKPLKKGKYRLRAYTKYMLNFDESGIFQKEIPVYNQLVTEAFAYETPIVSKVEKITPSANKKPIVRFFPEGGYLVSGLKNSMGIEATDKLGNYLSLKGEIVDQNGKTVSVFETKGYGLSKTSFVCDPDKKYTALVNYMDEEEKFDLPKPLATGYTMNVRNNSDHLLIDVATNTKEGLEGTLLLGHLRGSLIVDYVEKSKNKSTYALKLLTHEMDDGVAQFTLFSAKGKPLCERLVFVDNPDSERGLTSPNPTVDNVIMVM